MTARAPPGSRPPRYGVSHRIVRGADRRHQSYMRVESAGRTLRTALREVADALDDIHVPQQLTGRYRTEALEDETARLGREARDAAALVDAVLWAEPQLRLIEDDLDNDLAQWINIADVSFEVAGAGMAPRRRIRVVGRVRSRLGPRRDQGPIPAGAELLSA